MNGACGLPVGFRREAHPSLPSTNGRALSAARDGDPGCLWITAEEQTAGRGRYGRSWSTVSGNLAASLLLIDPALPAVTPTLSFVAGLALHRAVLDIAGETIADRLRLKWPNDLLLDGGKVAGILLEGATVASGRLAVVLGFGANCRSHPQIDGPRRAADFESAGLAVAAEPLFGRLAGRMAEGIAVWDDGAGFAKIREAWLERALGVGLPIAVRLTDAVIEGRFATLDASGRLVVDLPGGGSRSVSAGDVFFPAAG